MTNKELLERILSILKKTVVDLSLLLDQSSEGSSQENEAYKVKLSEKAKHGLS